MQQGASGSGQIEMICDFHEVQGISCFSPPSVKAPLFSLRTIPWSYSITHRSKTMPELWGMAFAGHSLTSLSSIQRKFLEIDLPLSFFGTPTAAQRTTQVENRAQRGLKDHISTLGPLFLHTRTGFSPH